MSDSLFRQVIKTLMIGPAQALASSTVDPADVVAAAEQGLGPPIFSEQAADGAANTTRVARVHYAAVAQRVLTLAIVVDTTVTGDAVNYKTFDVKKFANGGAISAALATQIATNATPAQDLTARTKKSFTLTGGYIDLDAGDTLVIDIGIAAAGVQLPKFEIVGTTQII